MLLKATTVDAVIQILRGSKKNTGSAEIRYNKVLRKAMKIILYRTDFQCFETKNSYAYHQNQGIYYMAEKTTAIVNSCCAIYKVQRHCDS